MDFWTFLGTIFGGIFSPKGWLVVSAILAAAVGLVTMLAITVIIFYISDHGYSRWWNLLFIPMIVVISVFVILFLYWSGVYLYQSVEA